MPNVLDALGLQTNTYDELLAYYQARFRAIYGDDINLESNTPDGQLIGILIQDVLDLQDLLVQVYNTFDPDNAVGVVLDQRVAINGIQRQAGTYTTTPVTIVNSQSVNLYGLDQTLEEIYTVQDNAGTLWLLQETQLGLAAGSHSLLFRAAERGAVLTVPNTINVPVTVVLGVTSVNNPTSYLTLGINEETDAVLKVRRQQSVALSSQGYLESLLAALKNINGVLTAIVYENTTSVTDPDGVPGHSIWVIVSGSGADSDIANAIYTKRNAGCGMFGDISYSITQVDGSLFNVYWDSVVSQNAFISLTLTSIDGDTAPNIAAIRPGVADKLRPDVNQPINSNEISTIVQELDANSLAYPALASSGRVQVLTLPTAPSSGTFKIRYSGNSSAAINWNDSIGTIQTKIRAVSGLSGAVVTGSIASKIITINLAAEDDIGSLIYAVDNSLGYAFSYDYGFVPLLEALSKKNQFVLSADAVLCLPMQVQPTNKIVQPDDTIQFTGLGGYGPYVFSATGDSGPTINAATGLYTAGPLSGNDTVSVVDALGNSASTVVTVA